MRIAGVAALAGVLLVLTGCGSAAPSSHYTATVTVAPSPAPTVTDRVTIPATPIGTPTPLASTDPGRPAGQCADSALKVSVTEGDAGAGNIDQRIVFTNTGSASCALRGTPGVSVVGRGDGTQLGKPASRNQSAVTTVTLAAGGTATSLLHSVNIAGGGGPLGDACTVQKGDGLRIYPPHSTNAVFVREAGVPACVPGPSWMDVGPVTAATP